LNLLNDNRTSKKGFKPYMNWKDFRGHTFPLTHYLLRLLHYIIECIIWLGYGLLRVLRLLFFGKKRDKDPSTSPRVNLVVFISMIVFYIVLTITILVFFLKSVLLYNPHGTINPQGAIVMPQDCGKEIYLYLFNSATCWANTGIKVLEGDEIELSASGSFFGKISLMDSCARNNSKPKYPRSIISYYNSNYEEQESKIDVSSHKLLMYNKDDARFGSLLMQIKEDNEDILYECDRKDDKNKQMMQIDFSDKKTSPHIYIKKSGVLYFAVNDIYLSPKIINTIKANPNLQNSLEAKFFVFYDSEGKPDTIQTNNLTESYISQIDPTMWFEDNVGEILLNITVFRDILPANSPKPTFMVKTYRWIENKFLFSSHPFFLWFFLVIFLWLTIDRMIGIITNKTPKT